MKKKKSIRKLGLKKLNIRKLDAAAGGAVYMSWAKYCSGSCNSCGNYGTCEIIGPSQGQKYCSQKF